MKLPPKQRLGNLSNNQKRLAYFECDQNWILVESSTSIKMEQLKHTPFLRIRVLCEFSFVEYGTYWKTISYHQNGDLFPKHIHESESSILEWLKQKSWQYRNEDKHK